MKDPESLKPQSKAELTTIVTQFAIKIIEIIFGLSKTGQVIMGITHEIK